VSPALIRPGQQVYHRTARKKGRGEVLEVLRRFGHYKTFRIKWSDGTESLESAAVLRASPVGSVYRQRALTRLRTMQEEKEWEAANP
jgi:hypothetical protein